VSFKLGIFVEQWHRCGLNVEAADSCPCLCYKL